MKRLCYTLLFAPLFFSACKKNDATGPTKMELITTGTWKFDKAGLDVNKDGFMDTDLPPGYLVDCDKDNVITFKSDGTGTVDEGASKCDPADPQTSPFTWSFKNNETILNFPAAVFNGITGDVTIQKLTTTELDMIKEVNIGAPTTVNVIFEMKR